jgi:tetratricopeptide (TPR) repeat protein
MWPADHTMRFLSRIVLLSLWVFQIALCSAQTPTDTPQELRNTYNAATQALRRQEFQTAASLARHMISLCPRCVMAHALLSASLLGINQFADAQLAAEEEIKLNPKEPIAYKTLGNVYWRQHDYGNAVAQFQKAVEINSQDYEAHQSLGRILREQKNYKDALVELEKALAISPDNPATLLVHGECEIDLGNTSKGVSEMERAVAASTSPDPWNSAAYELAEHDLELEKAQKWSETSLGLVGALLPNISLEHLTVPQWGIPPTLANYWDTLGWIYFKRADYAAARTYVEAAWSLRPIPTIGDHLGQTHEKLGRREDAVNTYAMAIAAADLPSRAGRSQDLLDKIRERLAKLVPADADIASLVRKGHEDLQKMNSVRVANPNHIRGSAEFLLKVDGDKVAEVHRISGDAAFDAFVTPIRALTLPVRLPQGQIPRRAAFSCDDAESTCRMRLLSGEEAMDGAIEDSSTAPNNLKPTQAQDPHLFRDPAIGVTVFLPNDWQFLKEELSKACLIATFQKPGTSAYFFVAHERVVVSDDEYGRMLKKHWAQHDRFRRTKEIRVERDGILGTRWHVTWTEKDIEYAGIFEFFTLGAEHYWAAAQAPPDAYNQFEQDFQDMLRSLKLPHPSASQNSE